MRQTRLATFLRSSLHFVFVAHKRTQGLAPDAADVIVHIPIFVLKNFHTSEKRVHATSRADGIRCKPVRPRPLFSSVPLVVPERARSWCVQPLWTAATQPPRLHAQNKVTASDLLRACSWTHDSWVMRDSWKTNEKIRSQDAIFTVLKPLLSSVLFKGNAVITGIHSMSKRIQFVEK